MISIGDLFSKAQTLSVHYNKHLYLSLFPVQGKVCRHVMSERPQASLQTFAMLLGQSKAGIFFHFYRIDNKRMAPRFRSNTELLTLHLYSKR
jgi:hypothetical protein